MTLFDIQPEESKRWKGDILPGEPVDMKKSLKSLLCHIASLPDRFSDPDFLAYYEGPATEFLEMKAKVERGEELPDWFWGKMRWL